VEKSAKSSKRLLKNIRKRISTNKKKSMEGIPIRIHSQNKWISGCLSDRNSRMRRTD